MRICMYTFSVKFNITPIRRLVPSISTADAPSIILQPLSVLHFSIFN